MSKKQKNKPELPPPKPKITLVSLKPKSEVNSEPVVNELPEALSINPESKPEAGSKSINPESKPEAGSKSINPESQLEASSKSINPESQPETSSKSINPESQPETSSNELPQAHPAKPVRKQLPAPDLLHLPENPNAFFQAVGVIVGDVTFLGKESRITIAEKSYQLLYVPTYKKALEILRMIVKKSGQTRPRLLVYPKITHYPKREQPPVISFQLVGFDGIKNLTPQLQDGEFKLSGLWQFIPVCQTPCITVQKNFTQERLTHVKESDALKRANFMKASHIPLLWRDALVKPFRFNLKLDKEHQGQALFVEIRAKFNSEQDTWEFIELCSRPSEPPQFLKLGKKDKAEALRMKQERFANSDPQSNRQ
jgi:hypothetical protein